MATNNELTMNDIEIISETAEKAISEDCIDIRKIQDSVEVDENAELVSSDAIEDNNGNIIAEDDEIDKIAKSFEDMTSDVSLFDVDNGSDSVVDINEVSDKVAENAKNAFDLSDEDALRIIQVINNMNEDPKYHVYANLPQKLQAVISKLAYDNNMSITQLDMIARGMMEEFAKEAGIDKVLVDFEKSLNEALKIPSVIDMYTEHTKHVMNDIIPETMERIRDEFPEKAKKLGDVRDAFNDSYKFESAKKLYNENSRLRKAIRRYNVEFKRTLDKFNYKNEKSNFKMNDVTAIPSVLEKILITDPKIEFKMYEMDGKCHDENDLIAKIYNANITNIDIQKFCILICKSCENRDPNDVIDAAYMYYLMRNIIVLRHTQEAKTDFAVELINNIYDTIMFIRDKECEFNGSHME